MNILGPLGPTPSANVSTVRLDPEQPEQRGEVFEPVSDPLILEMLEHVKQFYFIDDKADNIFDSEIKNMPRVVQFLLNRQIQRLSELNPLEERPDKPAPTVYLEDRVLGFEEYAQGSWRLDNVFEADTDRLEQMRRGRIFQTGKRCRGARAGNGKSWNCMCRQCCSRC